MRERRSLLFQTKSMRFFVSPYKSACDLDYPHQWVVDSPSCEFIDWVNNEFNDRRWRKEHTYYHQGYLNNPNQVLILMLTDEGAIIVKLRWCVNE
jgi:hypothetical protein